MIINHWWNGLSQVGARRWTGFTLWLARIWWAGRKDRWPWSLDDEADRTMFDG